MNQVNKQSAYMEWAKTSSMARFNLATSGLANVSTREVSLHETEMEITGPGGYGFEPLQQKLARHAGAPIDCVVAATGASMANYLAMSAVLDPGAEVLIEHPAYGLFDDIANYLGAKVTHFRRRFESGFEVDVDELAKRVTPATRLVVVTNLHNPSGVLMPEQTLRQLGEAALTVGAYVLVDEVYLEMLFDSAAPAAFPIGADLNASDNPFIVTNSLTKAYGLSGLRCGWILASGPLAKKMWRLNDLFGVNAAHIAELMSVKAFDRLDALRERARGVLTANRQLLDQFLDAHPELEYVRPPGGSVIFPRLSRGETGAFIDLLRQKYETSVVPGTFFGMPEHFRMGIGGETAMVRGGLERLDAALREDYSD